MKLVWQLLRENISKIQLVGFFVANLIGLSIILVACQFYFDIDSIFNRKDNLFNQDYYTITKKINAFDAISAKSTGFSPKEINELKESGFIKDMGAFTPSRYSVYGGINHESLRLSTEMFFESVPDKFVDVQTDAWHFSPEDNVVPIILPRNYLDMYNFGFAETRSMPKLTEGMIGLIKFDVVVWGNGQRKDLKGKIVGLSNRINTILVPQSFMDWANEHYGKGNVQQPSRIIAEINNISDPAISKYLKEKGYEAEGNSDAVSRMSSLLKILVTIVISVGIVICILSFIILMLSIYLLLEKNMEKLHKLRLIGYTKSSVTRPYELLVFIINMAILILSFVIVTIGQKQYTELVKKVWADFETTSLFYTLSTGAVITLLLIVINIITIRRKVK